MTLIVPPLLSRPGARLPGHYAVLEGALRAARQEGMLVKRLEVEVPKPLFGQRPARAPVRPDVISRALRRQLRPDELDCD